MAGTVSSKCACGNCAQWGVENGCGLAERASVSCSAAPRPRVTVRAALPLLRVRRVNGPASSCSAQFQSSSVVQWLLCGSLCVLVVVFFLAPSSTHAHWRIPPDPRLPRSRDSPRSTPSDVYFCDGLHSIAQLCGRWLPSPSSSSHFHLEPRRPRDMAE